MTFLYKTILITKKASFFLLMPTSWDAGMNYLGARAQQYIWQIPSLVQDVRGAWQRAMMWQDLFAG